MMRRSLRLRMTLWFAAVLALLCAVLLAGVALMQRADAASRVRDDLDMALFEASLDVESSPRVAEALLAGEDGELEPAFFWRNAVYLSAYAPAGELLGGLSVFSGQDGLPFSEETRSVELEGMGCLVQDRQVALSGGGTLWLRGVTFEYDQDLGTALLSVRQLALLAAAFVALALAGGWLLTGRALAPIRTIGQAADAIRTSGDLSQRIELSEAGEGDELHELAASFNAMFDRVERDAKAQTALTAYASHELRTPLAVIEAQCEYALGSDSPASAEELHEALTSVNKQAKRIERAIEKTLAYARQISAGSIPGDLEAAPPRPESDGPDT